jgi:hypothetical protein
MKTKQEIEIKEVIVTVFVGFYNKDGKDRRAVRQTKITAISDGATMNSLQDTVIRGFKETYLLIKRDIRSIK